MKIKTIEKTFKGSLSMTVPARDLITIEFIKAVFFGTDIQIEKFNTTITEQSTLDLGEPIKNERT